MADRAPRGFSWVREVWRALWADPILLAPAVIVIILTIAAAYLAWRYL